MYFRRERFYSDHNDLMKGSYLGPYYSDKEISIVNKKFKAGLEYFESFESYQKM